MTQQHYLVPIPFRPATYFCQCPILSRKPVSVRLCAFQHHLTITNELPIKCFCFQSNVFCFQSNVAQTKFSNFILYLVDDICLHGQSKNSFWFVQFVVITSRWPIFNIKNMPGSRLPYYKYQNQLNIGSSGRKYLTDMFCIVQKKRSTKNLRKMKHILMYL